MMRVQFGAAIRPMDVAQEKANYASWNEKTGYEKRAVIAKRLGYPTWNTDVWKEYMLLKEKKYAKLSEKKLKEKYSELTGREWVG